MSPPAPSGGEPDPAQVWAELVRLAQKIGTVTDPDIRGALLEALDAKCDRHRGRLTSIPPQAAEIQELRTRFAELPVLDFAPSPATEGPLPEPTPEDLERADALLRQAHVAQIRGNRADARRLLEQAAEVAPGAPSVLEALGDEYSQAGRHKEAATMYARAMKAAPGNVGIEKKHAQAVFNADAAAAGMALAMELERGESAASGKAAMILSVFVPGLGQIVSDRVALGSGILAAWLAAWVPLFLKLWGPRFVGGQEQFSGLDHILSFVGWGEVPRPSALALLLFFCAVAVHLFAILEASARSGSAKPAEKPARPIPPANLPFE